MTKVERRALEARRREHRVGVWKLYADKKINERQMCMRMGLVYSRENVKRIGWAMSGMRIKHPEMRVPYYRNDFQGGETEARRAAKLKEIMLENKLRHMAHENWPAFLRELGVSI